MQRLKPLNVVLVTIDTLRADHLGCYGYSNISTPAIDALAATGTLFEHAVAQTPLTPPSHASIFTGQNPNVHHVRNTGGFTLAPSAVTLPKLLRQQGWDTAAFVGASVLKKIFGFNQGFAVYDDQMPKPEKSGLVREDPERRAGAVVDRAVAWLNGQSGTPYLLWVHFFDPHLPYEPPEPFKTRYSSHLYDGEIAYVDRELGRLLDAVDKKDASRRTLIAVMADHGESLSEHGEFTHGVFLYDSTLHIPLVLAGPGVPAGARIATQARTIDVMPTILELLGVKAPPSCQGSSLVPTFSGKSAATEYSYAETLYPKMNMNWAELRGVRTNRWKYVRAPTPELYDLTQDPHELHNVYGSYPEQVRELDAQLRASSAGIEKVATTTMTSKSMEQLKSLGYLSGFTPREFDLTGEGTDPKDRTGILRLFNLAAGPGSSAIPQGRRIRLLEEALVEDPGNPSVYYHLGAEYERAGRYSDSLELYRSAIEKGVQNGRIYARMGDLELRAGNKQEAIVCYEKAAQFNPSDTDSQSNLALAYLETGRVADAERVYRWILASGEESAAAYNGLGLIAVQRQDLAGARANFEKAVRIDPELVEAQLNLGVYYRMAGDNGRARTCFQSFLAHAPRSQYAGLIAKVKQELGSMR